MSHFYRRVATAAALLGAGGAPLPARQVVMLVWDGMRPDLVSEQSTPTLLALSRRGVFFAHHHAVFVTSTEVNGTALSTGMYPRRSGIMANLEFRPQINPSQALEVESRLAVRAGDRISGGHYLQVPTVAEILRMQSPPLLTAIAGSKAVALLLDRSERPDDAPSPLLVEGATLPASALGRIVARIGAFPAVGITKVDRDRWTARALVEEFWHQRLPAFSVLWLAEPDWAQHHTGPGSAPSLAAIAGCDRQLAFVLQALADRHALADTDVIVVSDHGFSTIERNADLAVDLSKAGLMTARAFVSPPARGTILVTGLGGSAGLYVTGRDPAAISRAVAFLQQQAYTGVIFTRQALPGTFPLALAKIDTPDAPDILVSLRWSSNRSSTGITGLEVSETGAGRNPGQGTHAALSPTDLHNTLVAAGPDFKVGWVDQTPSGNLDLAPTILHLLKVAAPIPMDGRVLTEALTVSGPPLGPIRHRRATADLDPGQGRASGWHQYLDLSTVGDVTYLDQGGGAVGAVSASP